MLRGASRGPTPKTEYIIPTKTFTPLLLLLGLTACFENIAPASSPENPVTITQPYSVAFLIMDGVYNTELTASYSIFRYTVFREGLRPMRTFTVARTQDAVLTFEVLRPLPDYGYTTDSVPRTDILVERSAAHHLDTNLEKRRCWVSCAGPTGKRP